MIIIKNNNNNKKKRKKRRKKKGFLWVKHGSGVEVLQVSHGDMICEDMRLTVMMWGKMETFNWLQTLHQPQERPKD